MPILRRQKPCAQCALALAAPLIFLVAGCSHAPASPSGNIAKGQQSQPEAAGTAHEAPRTPDQVPVQRPRFAVQVAAFNDRPSAEAFASRLSDHFGLQTLVAPVESNGVALYRVRLLVGSKDDADKLAETFLRTENVKVWIVPL